MSDSTTGHHDNLDEADNGNSSESSKRPPIPGGILRLLYAMSANAMANVLLTVAIELQVYEITDSEWWLGLIGLAQFAPMLVLSLFTGTLADRFDRRWVFAAGVLIDIAATIGFLLYALTDPTSATPMLFLVALKGSGRAVSMPASRALPIDLAPEGLLERIVGLRSLTFQIALVIGPLIGAFANRASTVLPYVIALVVFMVALGLLARVPEPEIEKLHSAPGPRQALTDAVNGLRFIRRSPIIFGAITLDLFAVLFGGAVALLPAIVEKRLDVEDVDLGVGILRAAIAAGAALTAAALATRPIMRHNGPWLFGVIAIFGVGTIVLGITRSFTVALISVALISAADQISVYVRSSVVPLATPENMRGRVLAVENIFIGGSNQLGAFESGVTAAWFGLAPAIVIGGIGTLVVVGVSWFLFPDLRRVDRFADVKPQQFEETAS
ncbi:MAG: MFS transporter [Actinomycetota bacterium]